MYFSDIIVSLDPSLSPNEILAVEQLVTMGQPMATNSNEKYGFMKMKKLVQSKGIDDQMITEAKVELKDGQRSLQRSQSTIVIPLRHCNGTHRVGGKYGCHDKRCKREDYCVDECLGCPQLPINKRMKKAGMPPSNSSSTEQKKSTINFKAAKKVEPVVESESSSDEGDTDMFQTFYDMGMSPIVAKAMVEQHSKIVEQATAVEAFEKGKVAFGKSSGRDKLIKQLADIQSQISSIDESVEGKKWLVAPRIGGKSTISTAEQKDAKKARVIARKLKLAGGGVECEKCKTKFQAKNHFVVKHQSACVGKAKLTNV